MIAVQKLIFHVPELIGEVHMHLVRVHKTAGFIPERVQFFPAVRLNVHDRGRFVNAFSIFKYRNHQITEMIGVGSQVRLFPGLDGIEEQQ